MALAKYCEEIRITVEERLDAQSADTSITVSASWKISPDLFDDEFLPGIYYPSYRSNLFERVEPYPKEQQQSPAPSRKKKKKRWKKNKTAQAVL